MRDTLSDSETTTETGGRERESDTSAGASATGPEHVARSLQRAAGNQAVKDCYRRGELQPKLDVSRPGDPAEREAERVASEVVDSGESVADTETDVEIQRRGGPGTTAVGGRAEARIDALRGGGSPLPRSVRSGFESRFGRDFSDVRVHTGPQADAAARSIDAEAFTTGRDIAFAQGAYRPGTTGGRKLLAHELTHVVQQGGAGPGGRVDRQDSSTRRPERGASVAEVQTYLECTLCRPNQYGRCAHELSEGALRVLLAAGWQPDIHVSFAMSNAAETIAGVDEKVAHDEAIQTYLKVEYLVENADVLKGHMGDKQLSYPGNRPEFNTFWEQLGDEVLKTAIGELLPLSDAAGFALDAGLAVYNNHIADRGLQEDAIRDTIIHRLDDKSDENIRQLYVEGARAHRPLKQRRNLARQFLWDLPTTKAGFDGPEANSPYQSFWW